MIRNVCVTGGAGFIGSHMVDTLAAHGCRVTIVDNLRTGRAEFIHPDARFVHADITRDMDSLMAAIDGADWVVHLAANPDARGERRGVGFNLDQNLAGSVLDPIEAQAKEALIRSVVTIDQRNTIGGNHL